MELLLTPLFNGPWSTSLLTATMYGEREKTSLLVTLPLLSLAAEYYFVNYAGDRGSPYRSLIGIPGGINGNGPPRKVHPSFFPGPHTLCSSPHTRSAPTEPRPPPAPLTLYTTLYTTPMDPLWTPYGPPMTPLWAPYGLPMDPLWKRNH